ncbi:uncharacterized protein LOC135849786 [Planococcus citri]|uniref:uncharacterized protein LOC135849786 n=1 Tax=Planococcus citri TaxID=170843 RepID=UPI0031FA0CC1
MTYKCDKCDATFSKKYNVTRHLDTKHSVKQPEPINCAYCGTTFKRKDNLIVHIKRLHPDIDSSFEEPPLKKPSTQKRCEICDVFVGLDGFLHHVQSFQHLEALKNGPVNANVEITKTAFNSRIVTYKIYTEKDIDDIKNYLETTKTLMLRIIDDYVQLYKAIKFNLQLHVKYMKDTSSIDDKVFNTKNLIYDYGEDFTEIFYDQLIKPLVNQSEEFQEYDSGWTFVEVDFVEINVAKYDPFYGSSYIALPQWVKQKHAVINVTNYDKACFAWSIMSALFPVGRQKHPDRVTSYPHYSKMLLLDEITFPMKITDIPKFESLNPLISVNVFGLEDEKIIGPVYHTRKRKEHHINLLYIRNDIGEGHYCWIKDMSRLVGSQINHKKSRKYICDGCLMNFNSNEKLQTHQELECSKTVVELPEDERYLKFRSFHKTIKLPFVIYANFDTLANPVNGWSADDADSSTSSYGTFHEPYGFAYYVHCSFDSEFNKLRLYHGPNCISVFWSQLQKDLEWIYVCYKSHEISESIPYPKISVEDSKCEVCDKPFAAKDAEEPVYEYAEFCHDPTHPRNNANQRLKFFVPVVLHRLTEHHANFLIREVGYDKDEIESVPYSSEKRISFSKRVKVDKTIVKVRFTDSYRFLAANLPVLARNLTNEEFRLLGIEFPDEEELQFVKVPGIFPKDLLNGNESAFEIRSIPPKQDFTDTLSGVELSDDDYHRIQTIWGKFKCENLGDYADLCMKIDVLHLTDVFESFRTTCMSNYLLDPVYYYNVQHFSWDAMLKTTNASVELLTDFEMLQFFKNSIRGGLSQCSKRKAAANNKYMLDYDSDKDSSYLMYLTANDLYGWAMSQSLPIGKFRWLSESEINSFDVRNIPEDGPTGYVLEVDLEYPDHIHDLHSDFPFCPEKQNTFESSKDTKLIASVQNKSNYILHLRNLTQCLSNGLILTKIHRILEFEQSKWLKSYIDTNHNLSVNSVQYFHKKFYDSMNKSILETTLENIDTRTDLKLISSWDNVKNKRGAQYHINLPNYHTSFIFNENLVAIESEKLRVKYDKPFHLGFCILEYCKLPMYNFHYAFMKPTYDTNVELLYTCTNSFIYQVNTDDLYQDIKSHLDLFDTSDYPDCNRYQIPLRNAKLMDKFKDLFGGKLLLEFVGTKSKSYGYVVEDDKPLKQENDMTNFTTYLENISSILHHINTVRFNVYTQLVSKLNLYCNDDKRFVIPNSEKTLPWGHNKIKDHCL